MMKRFLISLALLGLSGCAGFTLYVQQHAAGIAAISLVGGATATVEQAVVNADEVVERARRHLKDGASEK